MFYKVEWKLSEGTRTFHVEAEVSTHGGVEVRGIWDPVVEVHLDVQVLTAAEKLSLIDAVRVAAGICARCSGIGKIVDLQKTGMKLEEVRIACPECAGSGKTPTPRRSRS